MNNIQRLALWARCSLESGSVESLARIYLDVIERADLDVDPDYESTVADTIARLIVGVLQDMANQEVHAPEFAVDRGPPCTLALGTFIGANGDNPHVCLWALSADVGDSYPACDDLVRVS